MKKLLIITLALLVAVGLLSSPFQAMAQDQDPEAIYRAAYDAFNVGDIDGGMALIADDVIAVLLPPPPGVEPAQTGKGLFRQVMEDLVAINTRWKLNDFHVNGETASYTVSLESDGFFADLGVYPFEFTGFVVVRDGLIVSEVWSMDEATRTKIDEAMAQEGNKILAHRYLEEMWDNGDMDVADEIIADDFVDYTPMFGNAPDKAGIMANATNFHEGGNKNRIDGLIVSEDSIVLRVTVMEPGEDNELLEGLQAVILLGVEHGQIIDRRVALFGFGPPWEN